MRRLPLAVGYTTKLPVTSEQLVPSQIEMKVTGIEEVQVPAGKYNCFKVSFGSLGQTFWIGTDRSRSLVKFQSGSVEAELVKTWGAEKTLESALAFLPTAGWKVNFQTDWSPFKRDGAFIIGAPDYQFTVKLRRTYTPPAEIPQALRQAFADKITEYRSNEVTDHNVRVGSVQERLIGGQQALSCVVDYTTKDGRRLSIYLTWIQTESTLITFETPGQYSSSSIAVLRWRLDPVLDMVRIP
jgi:hypothetical protein